MIYPFQHVKVHQWMNSEAIGEESLQVDWEETAKQDPIGQAGSCNSH